MTADDENGLVLLDQDEPGPPRLILVSAGNVSVWEEDHLARSDLEPVNDPAQAWNVLTVGAMTELDVIDGDEWAGWEPLAPRGDLSPFSRTSVNFSRIWPHKPDVVFEGGNLARSEAGGLDTPESMQVLTTRRLLDGRLLTTTHMTSAATAGAAHLCGRILARYPELWPETIRALAVHSAEWTDAMQVHWQGAQSRAEKLALRRRYGMGVPSLVRATQSATDALTLMVQSSLNPFDAQGRMGEMNLHDLPWPTDELAGLGGENVRLRITLSYFIEPNPSRRGWRNRYRYQSHGLRFDVRRPHETTDEFRQRVNQLARQEDEERATGAGDSAEWYFGPNSRTTGSLHTDFWEGTAADLAHRGQIAVFPVSGWWKDRIGQLREDLKCRYALVVSIEAPEQDVDLWTPVATKLGIEVEIDL